MKILGWQTWICDWPILQYQDIANNLTKGGFAQNPQNVSDIYKHVLIHPYLVLMWMFKLEANISNRRFSYPEISPYSLCKHYNYTQFTCLYIFLFLELQKEKVKVMYFPNINLFVPNVTFLYAIKRLENHFFFEGIKVILWRSRSTTLSTIN